MLQSPFHALSRRVRASAGVSCATSRVEPVSNSGGGTAIYTSHIAQWRATSGLLLSTKRCLLALQLTDTKHPLWKSASRKKGVHNNPRFPNPLHEPWAQQASTFSTVRMKNHPARNHVLRGTTLTVCRIWLFVCTQGQNDAGRQSFRTSRCLTLRNWAGTVAGQEGRKQSKQEAFIHHSQQGWQCQAVSDPCLDLSSQACPDTGHEPHCQGPRLLISFLRPNNSRNCRGFAPFFCQSCG